MPELTPQEMLARHAALNEASACEQCKRMNAPRQALCAHCGYDRITGSRKQPEKGTCKFCGRFGDLTREHFIPEWVFKEFDIDTDINLATTRLNEDGAFSYKPLVVGRGRASKTRAKDLTVRTVCESCNNGWMSDLQREAQPILLPILSGDRYRLHKKQADVVRRWMSMTACNAEYLSSLSYIADADRAKIMNGKPPSRWIFALGCADGMKSDVNGRSHLFRQRGQFGTMFSSVIVINKAVFYTAAIGHHIIPSNMRTSMTALIEGWGFHNISREIRPAPNECLIIRDTYYLHVMQHAAQWRVLFDAGNPIIPLPKPAGVVPLTELEWRQTVQYFGTGFSGIREPRP